MRLLFVISFLFIFLLSFKAQNNSSIENIEGVVSYLSSKNIYIKYKSTNGISIGDTLYLNSNTVIIPALIVLNLSSTSVVCRNITSNKISLQDKIIAKRKIEIRNFEKNITLKKNTVIENIDSLKTHETTVKQTQKQNILGRISISNYSSFSNTIAPSSYVFNYAFLLNINNVANSKFSLESNVLFRHEKGTWNNVKLNIFNGFKIYSLVAKYVVNKSTVINVGRKINSNITNIGAIDGLQAEKALGRYYFGGFVGSRPNYINYGFDYSLFQYGVYFGHNLKALNGNMQNAFAFVEQTNNMKTDRRFLYYQHSSSLLKNIYIFYSLEIDLYKKINESRQNTFNLTNTYISLRYSPIKKLTLSTTFDSRKNQIYYETDKNYLATLIESEARQGIGVQTNYSISRYIYAGAKAGLRFQKNDARVTKNGNVFITYTNLFKQQISSTFSTTFLQTNYLDGKVFNIKFSRGFISEKFNVGLGYSFADYKIKNAEKPLLQHIIDFNISAEIIRKISFSLYFENDFEKLNKYYRFFLQIRKRF